MDLILQIVAAAMSSGTPLLFAVLGGILIERSGIIQLGAEGIMLMGAVTAALLYLRTGSLAAALPAVLAVSAALGLLHAFLTVTLRVNQIVSGLAMTLFGSGLSAFLGRAIAGQPMPGAVPKLDMPVLDGVPVIGVLVAHLDVLTWLSFALVIALHLYIYRTSWGLHLRALGDSPPTADVMGIPVTAFRYGCVIAGTMLIGLGGADLLLVFSPAWIEDMTAGRGWIAVALIIFARWNPLRALLCAYFFGALDALGFRIQLIGSSIPSYFLKMIPYAVTILVLMYLGWRNRGKPSGSPESLGVPYIREQRL
ncbi:Inner-membrane translocator [Thermobacillus xylanilyticus]|jgi:simple sugar transport system permease protein|uniref:Inner-membrane translocator n=1 Tax=Thermobacillus xylanilyticus TaxID=76633 RepID=A0ABN7RXE2_THEXY|nr:ABC transporter permease [Thermobacillus xylanilyticus]REJ14930.1 MAG: ABC transporter permease [Paenibacillaceae bacterium]CAG5084826.1 Inner-membrane translocator [Thermobacillus xylanilyticus]